MASGGGGGRSKICKELQTAAISTVTFVPAQRTTSGHQDRLLQSLGEKHEQICDRAFDTSPMRDGAGGGSHGHTGQGRDERQRGNRKE